MMAAASWLVPMLTAFCFAQGLIICGALWCLPAYVCAHTTQREEGPNAAIEIMRWALDRQGVVLGAAPPVPSPIPSAEYGRGLG